MFNDHQDIIKIIEDAIYSAYCCGEQESGLSYVYFERNVLDKVQQRLEYMQSQIDELQLEYCPEEMSKEHLDNWAKNQVALSEDECNLIGNMLL